MSRARKEILIKAVAQAIPTFAMGCFDLTKGLCDKISAMIARFWWSQQDNEHKMHLLNWEKLTMAKEEGGGGAWFQRYSRVQYGDVSKAGMEHYGERKFCRVHRCSELNISLKEMCCKPHRKEICPIPGEVFFQV